MISIVSECERLISLEEENAEIEQEFLWNGEMWYLHSPEVKTGSDMRFAELTDSKQIVKYMVSLGANRWECLLPLCCIFLRRKDEKYHERFTYEESERMKLMGSLPMNIAMQVDLFFVKWSEYLEQHFPIFWPAKIKTTGKYTKQHFIEYGWINFQTSIARTKVFDMPGAVMNSIDCVRSASLYDVLWFASEEKEKAEAEQMDAEAERAKHK